MTQPEARLTKRIADALNKLPNTYVRKVHGGRYGAGWPDLIGSSSGRTLALEVKTGKGGYGVTKLQAAELAKWEKAGAVAGVVTSVDEALELMERCGVAVR
jgi:hypothetical protein